MSTLCDILGFGALAVDDLLYVDRYPAADGKVRVQRRRRQCGGLTGTALVAAARLGARCAYGGMLGADELSQFVERAMHGEGVDFSPAVRREDARPGHSTIIVDTTRNTRTVFSSVEGPMGADPSGPPDDAIRAAKVLLVDHHGVEGTIRAADLAHRAGRAVVADFERHPGGRFDELLPRIDHLVVSQRFAGELSGEEEPAAAAESLLRADRQAVVVTCGSEGCWYAAPATGRRARRCPAFQVDVVDTTGCGDVFHGAYAAALAAGRPLERCVVEATAAAALKATQAGGQAGCPDRTAVERFLAG